jgi:choline dehydrogenase
LLPYFKKALNFVPPAPALAAHIAHNASFWGKTSSVYAGWPSFQYPEVIAWVDTWKGMPGVEFPPDSGAGMPGVYWYPTFMSLTNITRSYARTGHYDNVMRANYHLLTGSKVTRLPSNGTKVDGVAFISVAAGSKARTVVRVNKEVILAAGAIHTPQLMQLSGFGPKALLDSANITTTVNLPGVGQNLQDHLTMTTNFTCG